MAPALAIDHRDRQEDGLLAAFADPVKGPIPADDFCVVVAHPDDETIGCGCLLSRLRVARVAMITDGAPRNLDDANRHGYASADDYAAARRTELHAALMLVGIPSRHVLWLGLEDQRAAFGLTGLSRHLAELFALERMGFVLTHAYEGGHPDHDATAFAVHMAARRLRREGLAPTIIEMPYYRSVADGVATQSFIPDASNRAVEVTLSASERDLKRRMLAAHQTQSQVLASFSGDVERFRRAPDYDFSVLPNGGALNYERHDWGMTGARWLELTAAAQAQLEA